MPESFLDILLTVIKSIAFTAELNKPIAEEYEILLSINPTLYTYVEITCDTLKFKSFCNRNTFFSNPTDKILPQLRISNIVAVGIILGKSMYRTIWNLLAHPYALPHVTRDLPKKELQNK